VGGDDHRKTHRLAKEVAKSMLTPPELAAYQNGVPLFVIDELGRKHYMVFAMTGRLLARETSRDGDRPRWAVAPGTAGIGAT